MEKQVKDNFRINHNILAVNIVRLEVSSNPLSKDDKIIDYKLGVRFLTSSDNKFIVEMELHEIDARSLILEGRLMDSLTSIDQSFFDFVWSSGIFAKVILLTLFALSLAAWTITLSKTTQFANLLRKLRIVFDEPGDNSNSALQKLLADKKTPIGRIYRQGNRVLKSSLKAIARGQSASLVLEEVKQQVDIATDEEISQLSKGLSFIGTVITVSPFLGLLGTVWGVMQAFVSIADSGNADLSTLAPGIAEALITTIAGLVVAIPAVFCYNFLNTRLKRIEDSLYRLSTELSLYFAKRWDHDIRYP